MTRLQKIGLIMSVISAILWIIGLFIGLYSDFSGNLSVSMWLYFIYFALIVIFVIGIGIILEEYFRKSLKRSLVILAVSCLIWSIFCRISLDFLASLCGGCNDHIGYTFGIFSLLFFILWFMSLFFVLNFLINRKKWVIIGMVIVFVFLFTALLVPILNSGEYLLDGIYSSLNTMFWLTLLISVILCIVAWIKSYKDKKKSS